MVQKNENGLGCGYGGKSIPEIARGSRPGSVKFQAKLVRGVQGYAGRRGLSP